MEEISESMDEIIMPFKKNRVNDSYTYSQKYKGVVQVYTNNQHIWIGTFRTELDAAIAYDRVSIKLRSSDASRNFPWSETTVQEAKFQSLFSMYSILAMIKGGSYQSMFDNFLSEKENDSDIFVEKSYGISPRLLFEKELTPSDVGKLNRLVIPKKHAVMYFPPLPDPDTDKSHGFANDEVILSFYDVQKKLWKFRYCYWKSSQSFVFTRGWNQFVKEKGLVENDKVRFYFLENPGMQNLMFYIIDTDTDLSMSYIGASLKLGLGTQVKYIVPKEEEASLKLGLGTQVKYIVPKDEEGSVEDHETKDEVIQASNVETKGIKLFGVQIA
ncbi:AP2/ERF and B3 domain-containing transcription factor like protein [Tanacetum coccineum]